MQIRRFLSILCSIVSASLLSAADRPNMLILVSDDQTYAGSGVFEQKAVKTPNFDRMAKNGVVFSEAYCSSPSCSPSRAAILTGRPFFTLEEAANLRGSLREKYPVFPESLEKAGYAVGHTGKGWGPGDTYALGRTEDPLGQWYMNAQAVTKRRNEGKMSQIPQNWAKNLEAFLDTAAKDKPFFFWVGTKAPHRPYKVGAGKNIDQAAIRLPEFLPDVPEVRKDLAAYLEEVEGVDRNLGEIMTLLAQRGLLENTLVIVTSDNGMPFPRCKGFLYDFGSRMPLAVQWPARIPRGRSVSDFVSLIDLAPTFLEAAGVSLPDGMTGKSLLPILLSNKEGRIEQQRSQVFLGRERHSRERLEGDRSVGYPMRGIRTDQFLYIRNFRPERFPASADGVVIDTDGSPSRNFIAEHNADPAYAKYWNLCFGLRPAEELYDVKNDPYQIVNLVAEPAYLDAKKHLQGELSNWMEKSKDPRLTDEGDIFDSYPVSKPKEASGKPATSELP